jgi:hypothetical protein
MPATAIDMIGLRFGRLVVLRREGEATNRQIVWLCRCDCGEESRTTGDRLRSGKTMSCGCYQREMSAAGSRKPDDEIGYRAAHHRVRSARGPASAHSCVDCGSTARDWSLRRNAAVTHTAPSNGYPCRISPDPNDYEPRCKKCHGVYDSPSRSGELLSDTPASGCTDA